MKGLVELREGKNFIGPDMRREMGLIPMIIWKLIGILQNFPKMWSRCGKGLKVSIKPDHLILYRSPLKGGLVMEKKRNITDSSFQGKAGFRIIMKVNWKSTLGSPSLFLPCRVPWNLSFSLSHHKIPFILN
jgi:hypothetical protein